MAQSTEQTEALAAALYGSGTRSRASAAPPHVVGRVIGPLDVRRAGPRRGHTGTGARRLSCRRAPHCSHDCWGATPPNGTIPAETPIRRVTAVGGNVGGVAVAHLSQRGGYERPCDVCRSAKER